MIKWPTITCSDSENVLMVAKMMPEIKQMDTDTVKKLTDVEIPMFERFADRLLFDAIQRYKNETQHAIRCSLHLELELRIVFSIVAVEMERRAATRDWSL